MKKIEYDDNGLKRVVIANLRIITLKGKEKGVFYGRDINSKWGEEETLIKEKEIKDIEKEIGEEIFTEKSIPIIILIHDESLTIDEKKELLSKLIKILSKS